MKVCNVWTSRHKARNLQTTLSPFLQCARHPMYTTDGCQLRVCLRSCSNDLTNLYLCLAALCPGSMRRECTRMHMHPLTVAVHHLQKGATNTAGGIWVDAKPPLHPSPTADRLVASAGGCQPPLPPADSASGVGRSSPAYCHRRVPAATNAAVSHQLPGACVTHVCVVWAETLKMC